MKDCVSGKGRYKRTEAHKEALRSCRIGKPTLGRRKVKGGYQAIHKWLTRYYGKADRCENKKCLGGKIFQWAKLKGKPYSHDRRNFRRMCTKCHFAYDMTPERRQRQSATMKRNNALKRAGKL